MAESISPRASSLPDWAGLAGVLEMRHDYHLDRVYVRGLGRESYFSASLFYWVALVLAYEIAGVGFGLLSLRFYATTAGIDGSKRVRDQGWPEIPALSTGTSIMGSALSFLLVFRLSWSFGRWWEARGLVGTAMTKLRNLASMMSTMLPRWRKLSQDE